MMHELSGDILLSGAGAIAHGVAPNDNFHQGLALALREMWPSLYKDFRHFCHAGSAEEGGVWLWHGTTGQVIANLFTQDRPTKGSETPGRASSKNVDHALRELARVVKKEKLKSLAIPRIATGVGGLDWSEVKPLVQKHLAALDIPVYVYVTYQKGVKAVEPA